VMAKAHMTLQVRLSQRIVNSKDDDEQQGSGSSLHRKQIS